MKLIRLFTIILIALNLSSCVNYYNEFFKQVKVYQDSVKLNDKDFTIDTSSFNIKTYFSLFDKLVFDDAYNFYIEYFYIGTADIQYIMGYPNNLI